MKALKLFLVFLVVPFFCWGGIYKIETIIHKDTHKKITFLHDTHYKNTFKLTDFLLKCFKNLANRRDVAVVFENNEEIRSSLKSDPSAFIGLNMALPIICHKLFLGNFKNFHYQDSREKLLRDFVAWICEVGSKKSVSTFKEKYSLDEQLKISLAIDKFVKGALKDISQFGVCEQKQIKQMIKVVSSSRVLIDTLALMAFGQSDQVNDVNNKSFYEVLSDSIIDTLPEIDWFKKIVTLSKSYNHVIVYLGGTHCENLLERFLECGYERDMSSRICLKKMQQTILLYFQVKDFFEQFSQIKQSKGISKLPYKKRIKKNALLR